ncbi:MAG: class I SAM-dependent methyltransferase [Chloroflexi bacterium]|nr:MAG: class I SAM-dependent methyltransferase [Chloroflexota bacterium]MBL1192841.1 class I SAM-dependent methyltransferase [Chloroflexota bacterium]NOH10134.1 class I SAM-dependent methyltransferase [Chloroflexota bacterium]
MTTNTDTKRHVREFYDQVGWQQVSDGVYQNARYEDLRPVARDYIQSCHTRVSRHIAPKGRYLLDAGSGPIQYPAYLEYSKGYDKRVCADISIQALREARKRIGEHGFFVVADISQLPFKSEAFDGAVSLHTIHHLPPDDHIPAYRQVHRTLTNGSSAVLVNGWHMPLIGRILEAPIRVRKWFRQMRKRRRKDKGAREGTFVRKYNATWLKNELGQYMPVDILVWRSISVMVLRTYVHARLGGRALLRVLYSLEERFPRFFGKYGQYPMVVIRKEE